MSASHAATTRRRYLSKAAAPLTDVQYCGALVARYGRAHAAVLPVLVYVSSAANVVPCLTRGSILPTMERCLALSIGP